VKAKRIFGTTNWKYALGEVALIVVGVSLALMANSWYEFRQERQEEILILEQIEQALEADVGVLQEQVAVLRQRQTQLVDLLGALRSDEILDAEMRPNLSAVHTWRGITLRFGPYEELKNRGLSLISSDSLRQNLVDLYDSSFQSLRSSTENDVVFSRDLALPYFYSKFRRLADDSWDPIEGYSELDDDVYFENLVAAKLDRLQQFVLPNYDGFLELTEQVLRQVRDELGSS